MKKNCTNYRNLYRNQRGVALLFALGMLSMLMILGLAFVTNSLISQKIAVNNSSRTQARMFARSAVSRAMASLMVYQQLAYVNLNVMPESFDNIYSKGEDNHNDGLAGSNSLMRLPEDESVVDKLIASNFNAIFTNNYPGSWVYFYNIKSGTDSIDRKIIGRAAWQVLAYSPPILYPVFFRGNIREYSDEAWVSREHRWGREIDEVNLDNTTLFANIQRTTDGFTGSQAECSDYTTLYGGKYFTDLGASVFGDPQKRWFERWFMPDPDTGAAAWAGIGGGDAPSMLSQDAYLYRRNKDRRQLMRFNISDFSDMSVGTDGVNWQWQRNYKTSGAVVLFNGADPWYARFGINIGDTATPYNSDAVLNALTRASTETAVKDDYDHSLQPGERSGLPYLRRIGRAQGTFSQLVDLRKQIAANFNDYCDADSIPTSDISAPNWWSSTTLIPSYTGNEKTPYLYELGFIMNFVKADNSGAGLTQGSDFTVAVAADKASAVITPKLSGKIKLAPIVKLANIYDFKTGDQLKSFQAGVDLSSFNFEFLLQKVSFTLQYVYKDDQDNDVSGEVVVTLNDIQSWADSKIEAKFPGTVDAANLPAASTQPAHVVTFTTDAENHDDNALDNSAGERPYPLAIPNSSMSAAWQTMTLTFPNTQTLTINKDIIQKGSLPAGSSLPTTYDITGITNFTIHDIAVSKVAVKPKRMVLSALAGVIQTSGTYNITRLGVDYVKEFAAESTWDSANSASWSAGDTTITINSTGTTIPGVLIGGICNYDPRQNLNSGDWHSLDMKAAQTTDSFPAALTDTLASAVSNVMSANKVTTPSLAVNGESNGMNDFAPNGKSDADVENATEVAYNASSTASEKRISTAYIRNAPMMSPWEIGFIHRAVKWQTINIKSADALAAPDNFNAVGWNNNVIGTTYTQGDGAILEQIKMSDRCLGYGKINVNMLRRSYPNFNETLDLNIAKALFDGIVYGQNPGDFIRNSTRDNDGKFPTTADSTASTSTLSFSSGNFNQLAAHPGFENRAQFLNYRNGSDGLWNAFGAAGISSGAPDAQQEEIIGKTINLITAGTTSPSQVQMVVLAQTINDVAGDQARTKADGTVITKSGCALGTFDMETSNGENIYYDEITGEVKMFVTIDRDPNTGAMSIRRIDYIE